MAEEFKSSVQKELLSQKTSALHKYRSLVIGRRGVWNLLKYEMLILLFSWVPGALGLVLRKIFYKSLFLKVGKGVAFGRNITLRHPHKIVIGDMSFIDDNVVLDAKGEDNEGISIGSNVMIGRNTIITCKEGSISIDDYCNISANCFLLSETLIQMGKYCFLAGQCYLVAGGNHSFEDTSRPIMFQPSISKGGISIEEDVWLGAGAVVLDGVKLGKGSVFGAGSVINGSFSEYSIAMGIPARFVKSRKKTNTNMESEPDTNSNPENH